MVAGFLANRLSRQTIKMFDVITIAAPMNTAGIGQSLKIIQPNIVAQMMLV